MADASSLHIREGRDRALVELLYRGTLSFIVKHGVMQQAGFPSETVSLTGRHYTQKWCSLTSQKYYVGLRDEY